MFIIRACPLRGRHLTGFAFGSVLRTPSGPPGGSRKKVKSEKRKVMGWGVR